MSSPFECNHANPWTAHFLDLPELNAPASDGIARAIERVRESASGERQQLASTSLLVLGPAGAGKTHLFMRLRRKLGPRAVFVHIRPLIGAEMTPRYVLGELVRQLDYESVAEAGMFRQLDALVGAAFAYLRHEPITLPRVQLDQLRAMDEATRRDTVDWAIEQMARRHPEIDDAYARRLLEVPTLTSIALRRASLAWLSGRELEQSQLERLGVGASLAEERIVPALQTLALFATPGTPIVLVFDQLENLMDPASTGERVRAYANLVAELFDTMHGVVITQMALDTEWTRAIVPQLSQTQKTRLDAERHLLALPSAHERRELVRLWRDDWARSLASSRDPSRDEHSAPPSPFPAPFGEQRLRAWCDAVGMTPRMLMIECRRALEEGAGSIERERTIPDGFAPEEEDAAIEAAWEEHLSRARAGLTEAGKERRTADGARLAGGIAISLRPLRATTNVKVEARPPLQVRLEHDDRAWGVALLQQMHGKAATAALDRLREACGHVRVVAVRERAFDFPPTWQQTLARLRALRAAGGRWLTLEHDDVARLLALESLLSAARSGDVEGHSGRPLDEPAVAAWIARALSLEAWPIARAIGAAEGEASAPEEVTPPKGRPRVEGSVVEACMARLRVAALERLVREVARVRRGTTRAEVLGALDAMGARVQWFGRSIVALRGDAR
jgi:hypothetical protein